MKNLEEVEQEFKTVQNITPPGGYAAAYRECVLQTLGWVLGKREVKPSSITFYAGLKETEKS